MSQPAARTRLRSKYFQDRQSASHSSSARRFGRGDDREDGLSSHGLAYNDPDFLSPNLKNLAGKCDQGSLSQTPYKACHFKARF
jgi:hypothetical protein